jgi:hypothetical protein
MPKRPVDSMQVFANMSMMIIFSITCSSADGRGLCSREGASGIHSEQKYGLDANSNVKCEITVFSDPLKKRLSLAVRVSPLPSLFPKQTASVAENNSGAVENAGAPDSGRFETFS